jgi:hypothetical protein
MSQQPYHISDAHIVDYEMYRLPGVDAMFRGPPVVSDAYVACIGAAQTFGRFAKAPFPALLSRELGIDALNLGHGGKGPSFHLATPGVMDYVNRAQVVVVQVLSGRSQSNSLFATDRHGMSGTSGGQKMSADQFYAWLLAQDAELIAEIIAETRANYVAAMKTLLQAIRPPKILFWFSVRAPRYDERRELPIGRLFGAFPQLVNDEMVAELRGFADRYVECISRRGLPQKLLDRNGAPAHFLTYTQSPTEPVTKTENNYYPSPEMHEDAASLLAPICRDLLLSTVVQQGPAPQNV